MRPATHFSMGYGLIIAATLLAEYFLLSNGNALIGQEIASGESTSPMVQEESKSKNPKTEQTNEAASKPADTDQASAKVVEARIRAKLLHEAFSGALQVMHRDYFREDQKLKLPSKSLEDVFSEMARSQNVQLRWIAVNANAMSVDHKPQNEFEIEAVAALSSGKFDFESTTAEAFKYVGSIRLSASCVKCHVRNRTSNDERKAGLVITIPLNNASK